MRRNLEAVAGVVCALALSGMVFSCRSSDVDTKDQAPRDAHAGQMASKAPSLQGDTALAPAATTTSPEAPSPVAAVREEPAPAPGAAAPPSGNSARLRSAMGNMFGAAHGQGGLGIRGTGSGGGGIEVLGGKRNEAVGIGTMGRGSGRLAGSSRASDPDSTTNQEGYRDHGVNPFVSTAKDRLSTFAADVDTASYTLARRKLKEGTLPPREAVRVEEMLNYFRYTYPAPTPEDGPFAVHLDAAPSPFTPGRHLLRVGVQGKRLSLSERKPAHLTFLVDVSGSMQSPDRLPLARRALRMLVDQLRDGDTVALVTYASAVRRVLPPTGMEHKARIHAAIEDLTAGGSTAMGSGIQLAYQEAMKTLDGESVSRVIILSDGDANVGSTSHEEILKTIRGHVKEGITVTTVGFGMGNYQDTMMEQLADQGNGNHHYVDSLMAARRIFVEQLGGTLEVIAKDVKLQVEFDPEQVSRYRLIGYENRDIADEDFRNDRVDAGELGSGHSVTALYELELKPGAGEGLATVRVRAKRPRGESASERVFPFRASALSATFKQAPSDLRFATAVMGAAELLRRSPHAEKWSLDQVRDIARSATPADNEEREEFLALLGEAHHLLRDVAAR
ncbi:von Willebrand factor A [Myxococcus fulvus 124B02]|nr:von Willebrand factor A [Myxococcus fulvus 124B02]